MKRNYYAKDAPAYRVLLSMIKYKIKQLIGLT